MIARELASKLGVSEAMVSYLLSGDRRPSLEVMDKIKTEFDWPIDDQWTEIKGGTYHHTLKALMRQPTTQPCP